MPVLRKLLHAIAVLVLASFGTFMLANLNPGDPAYTVLGDTATPAQIKQVDHSLGYDKPLLVRYFDWADRIVLHGDFGHSLISGTPIDHVIARSIPVSGEVAILGWLMAIVIAVPAGIYASYRASRLFDRTASAASSALISSPVFLTGLVLVYILAVRNHVFPVFGWTSISDDLPDNLYHAFIPSLTLALVEAPLFMRVLRSDMIATLQEDYILFAKAKGLSERYILIRHALRPSSLSLVTLMGLSLGRLLGGVVIVEVLFALPGLGRELMTAVSNKDIPTVLGISMFIAIVYIVINTLVDLVYSLIDSRTSVA